MIFLFIASFILVLYGTLFPFSFQADAHTGTLVEGFLASLAIRPGGGDVVSNTVLFLPFGFFGIQALSARIPKLLSAVLVLVLGAATSLGIEIAQFYLTMRSTSVYDVGLNIVSVLIGACAGGLSWQTFIASGTVHGIRPRTIFPLILVVAWAGYRLFPYVPTIDFQQVKDALKPLLVFASVPIADVVRHFGMVLGLALLLQALLSPARVNLTLMAMALGVIAAKPFIITKTISPAEVIGTLAALVIWLAVLHRASSRALIIAIIFAAALVFQGLAPFEFLHEPAHFSFIPFSGFEQGSMSVNIQSFLEKVFLYGALVWLIIQTGVSARSSVGLGVILTSTLEFAQRYIVGRSPEITDPLLVLLLGGLLLALENHYGSLEAAGKFPTGPWQASRPR